ncbi:hypothetical protein AGR1C_Cc70022 [Agrobacterium fabacearum TT111]|nr:hypothetical protein AGR1C_Cc70022 [Agrobacterium fabacearum TT111]
MHRPYASMNWIRFNGSLRIKAESQPLDGTPLVNGHKRKHRPTFVKGAADGWQRWTNNKCAVSGN